LVNIGPDICTYWNVGQWSKWNYFFLLPTVRSCTFTMPIVCRKNLNQSDRIDCKIITIEEEGKVFGGEPELLSMFWNSIEIRWIGLKYAKV
jgi:hypothetical protein